MTTKKGVWNLQQTRDKQLQDLWGYTNAGGMYITGGDPWSSGVTAQNDTIKRSSPVQVPGEWALEDSIFASGNKITGFEKNVMAIKTDGTLWGWGDNNKGKLAQNNLTQRSSPVQVPGTTWNVLSLAGTNSEGGHCIKTDGTLWAWGDNDSGQLGLNNKTEYSSPVQVPGTTWKATITDGHKFMAFKTDGTLWTCGYNGSGQLGHGDTSNESSPKQVPGTTWGDSFGTWDSSALAVKTDGTLWAWGANTNGVLGQNNLTSYSSPKQIPGTTWSKVNQGLQNGVCALKTDGTLWSWGYNREGSLGLNSLVKYSSPVQIPGTTWDNIDGSFISMVATKTDGSLWVWGYGGRGALDNNAAISRSSPTQIPGTWEKTVDGGGYITTALKN